MPSAKKRHKIMKFCSVKIYNYLHAFFFFAKMYVLMTLCISIYLIVMLCFFFCNEFVFKPNVDDTLPPTVTVTDLFSGQHNTGK